jgi:hypothetical protein
MSLVIELAALVVGVAVLAALIPRVPERPRRRPAGPQSQRPVELERLEWMVGSGRHTAGDVQVRVRPVLRGIAGALLRRQGVRLDAEPEQARALLGDELWELVRPGRPRPSDHRAPGLELGALERLVERLERL